MRSIRNNNKLRHSTTSSSGAKSARSSNGVRSKPRACSVAMNDSAVQWNNNNKQDSNYKENVS